MGLKSYHTNYLQGSYENDLLYLLKHFEKAALAEGKGDTGVDEDSEHRPVIGYGYDLIANKSSAIADLTDVLGRELTQAQKNAINAITDNTRGVPSGLSTLTITEAQATKLLKKAVDARRPRFLNSITSLGVTPRALLQLVLAGCLAGQAGLSRADPSCFAVSPIVLGGVQRTTVCQADIPGLLRANLFPASDKEWEKPLVDLSSGVTLTNCLKYYKFAGLRGLGPSRMESYREFRIYMPVCYTLIAVASASRPRASLLPANPLLLDYLPPTLLPGVTRSQGEELEEAEARGETAETYLRKRKRDDPAFDRTAYLQGWQVSLLVRADFDGDGYDDALVRYGYEPEGEHYFGYNLGVLTRKRASETVRWTYFPDFKWRRLPGALRGKKSPGK